MNEARKEAKALDDKVKEVQKLKQELADKEEEDNQKNLDRRTEVNEASQQIIDRWTDTRIAFETARLRTDLEEEKFADAYYEADNQYWENRHEREEIGTWFVKYDVQRDDMRTV